MRTLNIFTLLFFIAWFASGCKSELRVGAVSLECTQDDQCAPIGDEWRCFKSICILNTAPELDEIETYYAVGDSDISQTAVGFDLEGDDFTITWTALPGLAEELMPTAFEGEILSLHPVDFGVYYFEVSAFDGYSTSEIISFRLVIQPDLEAVYISDAGVDEDGCGRLDTPCASIAQGMTILAENEGEYLLLAGLTGAAPYSDCLKLSGNEQILGCFDPITWKASPELRDRCRIECDDSDGHQVSDETTLRDLVLAMSPGLLPPVNSDSIPLPLMTLFIDSGTPLIENVDIEAASCGTGCATIGLGSIDASPTLRGVDIRGTVDNFEPLDAMVGMLLLGGSPVIEGDSGLAGEGRGQILLNAPAIDYAGGIIAARSEATISGLSVKGGPANDIYGIAIFEGVVSLDESTIDISGFGTRNAYGAMAAACPDENAEDGFQPCTCAQWRADCEDPAALDSAAQTSITNSRITIQGASEELGQTPCVAAGASVDTALTAVTMQNNQITIGKNITLAIGLATQSGVEPDPALSHLFQGNMIEVGEARTDPLCILLNANGGDLDSGSIGMIVENVINASYLDNTISIAAHEKFSAGAFIGGYSDTWGYGSKNLKISGNTFEVGASTTGIKTQTVLGLALGSTWEELATEGSEFSRNSVVIADAELDSSGLPIGGPTEAYALQFSGSPEFDDQGGTFSDVRWRIENNMIYGGRVPYSTAMSISTTHPHADWPIVRHNTIHGGGNSEVGLISQGLILVNLAPSTTVENTYDFFSTGSFENNLIDGGLANGRNVAMINWGSFDKVSGNIGQFAETNAGPRPVFTLAGRIWQTRYIVSRSNLISIDLASIPDVNPWWILLEGTGEILPLALDIDGTNPRTGDAIKIGGKPGAYFMGSASDIGYAAVAIPGAVALAEYSIGGRNLGAFVPIPIDDVDGDGTAPVPCAITMLQLDGLYRPDILFVTGSACGGNDAEGGFYAMFSKSALDGGGYHKAIRLDTSLFNLGELLNPTILKYDSATSSLIIVDGTKLMIGILATSGESAKSDFTIYDINEHLDSSATQIYDVEMRSYNLDIGEAAESVNLTLISDVGTYVFLDLNLNNLEFNPAQFDGGGLPCGSAVPLAMIVDNLDELAADRALELGLSCWDEGSGKTTVGVWEYDDSSTKFVLKVSVAVDMKIGGMAAREPACGGTGPSRLCMASIEVISAESNQINHLIYSSGTSTGSPSIIAKIAIDMYGQIALMDHLHGTQMDYTFLDGMQLKSGTDVCELVMHNASSPSDDLHLAGSANACVDIGEVLDPVLSHDIDGCGARSDSVPDVGADEISSEGSVCEN
ncbi:hypothetical protein KAI87_11780 [Myxococcota bacterium]|nr:hypothetical protein [Myxococcota bacterium]